MISLIFMIILGLIVRKIFVYLSQIKQQREKYHGGLRQLADHMHTVTRTISNDPNENNNSNKANSKPRIRFEGDELAETSFNLFKPSVHEMVRSDTDIAGAGSLTTQLDARRISRMQDFLNHRD